MMFAPMRKMMCADAQDVPLRGNAETDDFKCAPRLLCAYPEEELFKIMGGRKKANSICRVCFLREAAAHI